MLFMLCDNTPIQAQAKAEQHCGEEGKIPGAVLLEGFSSVLGGGRWFLQPQKQW